MRRGEPPRRNQGEKDVSKTASILIPLAIFSTMLLVMYQGNCLSALVQGQMKTRTELYFCVAVAKNLQAFCTASTIEQGHACIHQCASVISLQSTCTRS